MDGRGRFDGPTHPRTGGLLGVDRPGHARMALRRLSGAAFVEVTAMAPAEAPVRATLTVRAGGKVRTYPVEIAGGTVRVLRLVRG